MSSANNVCQLYLPNASPTYGTTIPVSPNLQGQPTNGSGYYCTNNGADFPARTATGVVVAQNLTPNVADSVGGGAVPGDVRILATFDYALNANMMVGARLGYVARTYPGVQAAHFPPFHGEARYSYVFGDDPIGKAGLHPFLLAGAGVSEFDASVNVAVQFQMQPLTVCNQPPVKGMCEQTVSAWRTGGPFFLEAGGGGRWEMVPGFAALLDIKLVGAIGGSSGFSFVPTPEVAIQFGF